MLATLMLRGPQTAAELRLNSERLHRFADISSVEAFLDEMAAKDPPRVVRLARAPGAREARWMHLLCGDVVPESASVALARDEAAPAAGWEALEARVAALEQQVAALLRAAGSDEPGRPD